MVDSSGSAISFLLQELNQFGGSRPYSFLSSRLLGHSTHMKEYVYIYWSHKTQVLDYYVHNDKDDLFAWEPFVAQFTFPSQVLPSLVLVPLHTLQRLELEALYDVFLNVSQHWQSKDIILLGDFSVDCVSLTGKCLDELVLWTQAGFLWVSADGEDTIVRASTRRACDRTVRRRARCQPLLRAAAGLSLPRKLQLTEEEALGASDTPPWRSGRAGQPTTSSPSAWPLCCCHSWPLSSAWWPELHPHPGACCPQM